MFLKKLFKSNPKNTAIEEKSKIYVEKIDKVLNSLVSLFEPFKNILIKTLPFTKPLFRLLDFIFIYIAKLIRLMAIKWPLLLSIIKSKFTVFLFILLILVFFSGALITRYINTFQYVKQIEKAVYNATGYNASINGKIKFNTIPLSMDMLNISFNLPSNANQEDIYLSSAQVENITIHFKLIPLLWGELAIDKISLIQPIISYSFKAKDTLSPKLVEYKKKISKINLQNNSIYTIDSIIDVNTINNDEQFLSSENEVANEEIKAKQAPKIINSYLEKFINSINNSSYKINKIIITKGRVSLLDSNQSKIVILDNITTTHNRSFLGAHNFEGNLRYNNNLLFYKLIQNKNDYILRLSTLNELNENNQNYLEITLNKDIEKKAFYGELQGNNLSFSNIANIFSLDASNFQKNIVASLVSKIKFEKNILELTDIAFNYDSISYKGNIFWDFARESVVDINLSVDGLTLSSKDNIIRNNNKSSKFINLTNITSSINKTLFMNTKANLIGLDLKFNNIYIENILFDNIALNVILNPNNDIYIDNLKLTNKLEQLTLKGKINLEDKTGKALLEVFGEHNIANVSNFTGLILNENLMNTIFNKPISNYSLKAKLILDNNKILFNNLNGFIGEIELDNSSLSFLDRINSYEANLNLNIQDINLQNLYNTYLIYSNNSVNFLSQGAINTENNYLIKVALTSNNLYYSTLKLKDFSAELDITNTTLSVKKFTAKSGSQGYINAGFSLDFKSLPMLSGSILFDNLFVDLEALKGFIFNDFDIIGNMILNGRVKLTAKQYNKLDSIEGDLSFVKQERLKLNRFNPQQGIYLTISNSSSSNKYFINDIYGSVKIVQNKIDFYPVFLFFLKDKKEYRGSFLGSYDILADVLNIDGSVDNVDNINNKIIFTAKGDLLKPDFATKEANLKQNNKGKVAITEQDILNKNSKSHNTVNNLNNTNNKDHFNNNYNNQEKEAKKKIDDIFNSLLDENTQ
jgi:hypothetical protein